MLSVSSLPPVPGERGTRLFYRKSDEIVTALLTMKSNAIVTAPFFVRLLFQLTGKIAYLIKPKNTSVFLKSCALRKNFSK